MKTPLADTNSTDQRCRVWEEQVTIPTYGTGSPDRNPMFFEKRVYQGSSGAVYPNPVIEKIDDEKVDRTYNALFLENAYLKIMILPELGGRVQLAYDKIAQRHFIYYNQVIKPALVGLTGPWISGGIEFNWPQHHRPSTFEPVDHAIAGNTDGSCTLWVSEIEKMSGTKGMAAFTLRPGHAYLEIGVTLYNRTPLPQTFLWWANPAVKVNDHYQSVFPPDVNAVFDHGKRDVSTFPIATGTYYKVDYSPGTDISRYRNIPVPTSYMAVNSTYDFVGGYEHDSRAGLLHVADHHVSPGKKQWTWGHSDFGQAWDRNLTDEDGPYIELMTGVFTDNQPDFSWLMPYETKTFTQYFLPYRELGLVKNATKDVLVSAVMSGDKVEVRVFATSRMPGCRIHFSVNGQIVFDEPADLSPEEVFEKSVAAREGWSEKKFLLAVSDNTGAELIRYEPANHRENPIPAPASPALQPDAIATNEQLFLTGLHLEQYRHATYSPVPYYEEALRRDAGDSRCNNALGAWYLRRGRFDKAEPYFRTAIATLTARNPNPYDGEPLYNLGLCLDFIGRYDEAYDWFYKATWNKGWQATAFFALARIDLRKKRYANAMTHLQQSLDRDAGNVQAWSLLAEAMRLSGREKEAASVVQIARTKDRFHLGTAETSQLRALSRENEHTLIAAASDFASAGLYARATALLEIVPAVKRSPLAWYYLAYWAARQGKSFTALLDAGSRASTYLCFPNRLDDIAVLEFVRQNSLADAKAPYLLGNLFYDKRQYDLAIANWELALKRDPAMPTVQRNLGIAAYNKQHDPVKALAHYEEAYRLDVTDARVLMEVDQLYKRLNRPAPERLSFLESNLDTLLQRDDLYLERAALYNFTGDYRKALDLITDRHFHPWEGGEGKVSGQYVYSLVALAREALSTNAFGDAISLLERAQVYPHQLGEGKLYGARENDIHYWLGCAFAGLGDQQAAKKHWQTAAEATFEPGAAIFYNDQRPDNLLYSALSWRKLGDNSKSEGILSQLVDYGTAHVDDHVTLDYFAVSLPDLLVFDADLDLANSTHCRYLIALGLLGLGRRDEARGGLERVLKDDAAHFGARAHLDAMNLELL